MSFHASNHPATYLPVLAPGADPYFANTKLLLNYDGADASTTFTDLSAVARGNATVLGNAQADTAQFQFGTASGLFDGVGDYLTYADSADWNFGTAPFTVETWIRPSTVAGALFFLSQWIAAPNLGWAFWRNGTTLLFSMSTTGSDNVTLGTGGTLVANQWQHVCCDFDGIKYRVYLNGVMVGSSTTLRTPFDSTAVLAIGAAGGGANAWQGWIDETRITKGICRYGFDGGFTVPTAAFPTF